MHAMPGSHIIPYQGKTPELGEGCLIASCATIIGDVICGKDSSIWFNVTVRGDCHYIRIGNETNIQDNSVVHVTNKTAPTIIKDRVTIGHAAVIHGCTIESKCLIGMNATILDKVIVGEQSMVGAGSLLPPGKQYPPRHLILGSPAKAVRPLTEAEIAFLDQSADNYLAYKKGYGA